MSIQKTEDQLEMLESLLQKMAHVSIEPGEGDCSKIIERFRKCSRQISRIISALEALNGFSFLTNKQDAEVQK
jgi:hypothetical protein